MADFNKIKLVIWDLDDTFWKGTLSEGEICLSQQNIDLIRLLTDAGIVNAICSKNTESDVDIILKKYDLGDYFVFNSINWEPKGQRISTMLKDMRLRAENVLFIDDNISNLNEATFYNPGLMCSDPVIIDDLYAFVKKLPKKDESHKRLGQYKLLENKTQASHAFSDNEKFLYSCDIHVAFHNDCMKCIDRLHELILRTNQLNYTKKRSSKEEFLEELKSSDSCGYVTVQDNFGDYGIVGLYVIKNATLQHFLFSCRTIGQGVEQYVYAVLGYPSLVVKGEVATALNKFSKPRWIKKGEKEAVEKERSCALIQENLLFKGPCDMSAFVGYLQMNASFVTEFSFTDDEGHLIETQNHSAHIIALKECSENRLEDLYKECFFLSDKNFRSRIYDHPYKIVFLSTLIEGVYGLYQRKETGEIVAFGHYDYPMTDAKNWQKYIDGSIQNYGYTIQRKDLELFAEKYQYIGRTTPQMYRKFLGKLMDYLAPNTHLCLILGSEIAYEKEKDSTYVRRENFHREMNRMIRQFATGNQRIHLVNLTDYIHSQKDFTNNINHFVPNVYYQVSNDIIPLIKEICGKDTIIKSNRIRYLIKKYLQPIVLGIMPISWYSKLRRLF